MSRCSKLMVFLAVLGLGIIPAWAQTPTVCMPGTYLGPMRTMGNGTVSTWVTVDSAGQPLAIGVAMSEGALQNLPMKNDMYEYALAFPPQASATPFNHLGLDWNPRGHIPAEIYGVPHFDFHFYLISPEERKGITATGEDLARLERTPEAQFIPEGYQSFPGSSIPTEGAHWFNPASPEFHGQPFGATFIYGFYNGRMVFIEPMVTRAYLLTHPAMSQRIGLPAAYQTPGYYPTMYSVRFDPVSRLYYITLGGLTRR